MFGVRVHDHDLVEEVIDCRGEGRRSLECFAVDVCARLEFVDRLMRLQLGDVCSESFSAGSSSRSWSTTDDGTSP